MMDKLFFSCFLLVLVSFQAAGQDPFEPILKVDSLPEGIDTLNDPDPALMSTEYELIILDGDTLLRSNITQELFNKDFRKVDPITKQVSFGDSFATDWSTTNFNPYKEEDLVYPLEIDFTGERFTMPIEGVITSRYGWRRGRAHKGIDIDLVTGDNVKSVMDGKIRFAQYYGGLGRVVVIRHRNGLETIYAHLSKILVKPNDIVISGQVIGKGGNTGRSRGSHLHFEARYKNQAIHPDYLFDFDNRTGFNSSKLYVDDRWMDPAKHRSYKKSKITLRTQPGLYVAQETATTPVAAVPADKIKQSPVEETEVEEEEYHVIRKGDTLSRIASRYKVTIDQLCDLNLIKKSSVLKIGKQIRVK